MLNSVCCDSSSSGGIGFFGILAIVFIVLKLLGKITWSWIWVLCPIWGGFIVFILFLVIYSFAIIKSGK